MTEEPEDSLVSDLSAWCARMSSGEATQAEREAFEAWLAAAPERREAYGRFQAMLDALDDGFLDETAPEILTDVAAPAPGSERRRASRVPPRRRAVIATTAMAASLLAAAGLAWLVMRPAPYEPARTTVGEQRTIRLADGSAMTLNTDTMARYRITSRARSIRLDGGEAFFEVAKNPNAPFVVTVGQGQVTAIGTAFNVRVLGERTEVAVKEGIVAVAGRTGQDGRLLAGDRASIDAQGVRIFRAAESAATVDAWTHGRLVYRNQPLSAVVRDLDRYFEGRLETTGPMADTRVSAVINLGDERAVLAALAQQLPISVSRERPGVTRIIASGSQRPQEAP